MRGLRVKNFVGLKINLVIHDSTTQYSPYVNDSDT